MELVELRQEESLRNKIVNLLTTQWPQSTNELFKSVRSDLGIIVSYQAVHKSLRQLVADGCLVIENKRYRLNEQWIQQISEKAKQISLAYNQNMDVPSNSFVLKDGIVQNTVGDWKGVLLELIDIYRGEFNPHNIFQGRTEDILAYLDNIQKEHELFIAVHDGGVVGGCVLERKDKNIVDEYKIWKLKHFALIDGLDSSAEQRIIKDIELRLKTKSKRMKIQLNLAETEPRYITMFEEYGFTKEATLEDRYRVGEKMFIYSRVS